jgi:hypothetical protein
MQRFPSAGTPKCGVRSTASHTILWLGGFMKLLRDKIANIIWTATENYENGAEPSCGSVADAIIDLLRREGIMNWYKIRVWRLAYSRHKGKNDVVNDDRGLWKHLFFGVWYCEAVWFGVKF